MTVRLIAGSAHDLSALPDGSIHLAAFSPPYLGLRKYHGDQGVAWPAVTYAPMVNTPAVTVPAMTCPLGNEATIEAYIGHLVLVQREVWRVLRDDGVCFVNLGDSYANDDKWGGTTSGKHTLALHGEPVGRVRRHTGLKPKDLTLVPARFALAMQAEGWYIRNDIIWAKGVSFNPVYSGSTLPMSRTDAFTQSHEYVWLLAKQERYFFDLYAVKEAPASYTRKGGAAPYTANGSTTNGVGSKSLHQMSVAGRTPRTVWTINPTGYRGAHFAVWPEELVEKLVRVGTSAKGVCPTCGAPWKRVVQKQPASSRTVNGSGPHGEHGFIGSSRVDDPLEYSTFGWIPTCNCYFGGDYRPDDFEVVWSPTGEQSEDDPSLETGRAGWNRTRAGNEGRHPMTRYEQRHYADQLRRSPHRAEMKTEAGAAAFAHYLRTDRAGARPVPVALLDRWIDAGWLTRVEVPFHVPALLDDPELPEDAIAPAVCARCDGSGVDALPMFGDALPCPACGGQPVTGGNDAWRRWRAEADEAQANRQLVLDRIAALGNLPVAPAVVLDVFSGSGTTGAVATQLGRDYIGIDINPGYHALAEERIGATQIDLFAGETP
ncbi:MAG: hypothetical protein IPK79_00460 [Vampirovibrionales bacterium]|nr:hypothetical protein [Vampirovibrionales bacterium]